MHWSLVLINRTKTMVKWICFLMDNNWLVSWRWNVVVKRRERCLRIMMLIRIWVVVMIWVFDIVWFGFRGIWR